MATAAVQIPSSDLPFASYPDVNAAPPSEIDIDKAADDWALALTKALSSSDFNAVGDLFHKEACWRDQLGLSVS